ncbi:MAG: hypothetical protein WCB19_05760 [Thermoplasmata archaeon]
MPDDEPEIDPFDPNADPVKRLLSFMRTTVIVADPPRSLPRPETEQAEHE